MSVIFFMLAIFWSAFAWHDYGVGGLSHDFWVDIFMIFFCLLFAFWTAGRI